MFSRWWFQIFFIFTLSVKIPILTNIFQRGWNHHLFFQEAPQFLFGSPVPPSREPRLVANASSEEATLRLRAEVLWRAKGQPFFVWGESRKVRNTVDGRNPAHQLRGSFKGGNFKPCLFPSLGKWSKFDKYFSDGLKPPASSLSSFFLYISKDPLVCPKNPGLTRTNPIGGMGLEPSNLFYRGVWILGV